MDVGDTLAYNQGYFKPDPFNNKNSVWKAGVLAKVALMEGTDTFEDSSAVSEDMAKRLGSDITKVRYIFVNFEQNVNNIVNSGDKLDPESILCTVEDSVTSDNGLFNEDNLHTLKLLSANAPKAKYAGYVDKVEVIYYGDKEDMSDSLRSLADQSDEDLAKQRRSLGQKVVTGQVEDSLRIDNKTLEMDTAVIKFFLTKEDSVDSGDKIVFANQMKSVIGRVMVGQNKTEDGEDIDAIFGYNSIVNRVVLSPEIIGTTNTLLKVISKHVAKVYFEG